MGSTAETIVAGVGGLDNITKVDDRLVGIDLVIKDPDLVDVAALTAGNLYPQVEWPIVSVRIRYQCTATAMEIKAMMSKA